VAAVAATGDTAESRNPYDDSEAPEISSSLDDIVGNLMHKIKKEAGGEALDRKLAASKERITTLLDVGEDEKRLFQDVSDKIRNSLSPLNGAANDPDAKSQTSIKVRLNVKDNEQLGHVVRQLTDAKAKNEKMIREGSHSAENDMVSSTLSLALAALQDVDLDSQQKQQRKQQTQRQSSSSSSR